MTGYFRPLFVHDDTLMLISIFFNRLNNFSEIFCKILRKKSLGCMMMDANDGNNLYCSLGRVTEKNCNKFTVTEKIVISVLLKWFHLGDNILTYFGRKINSY
jgi:hypothetical protein